MGVSLYMRGCKFFMPKENIPKALAAVNLDRMPDEEFEDLNDAFRQQADLIAEIDGDDNVNGLEYEGGKCLECRDEFFKDIAPFVEKGSWIQWETEEGYLYRDYFNGKELEELECFVISEDPKGGPIKPKVGEFNEHIILHNETYSLRTGTDEVGWYVRVVDDVREKEEVRWGEGCIAHEPVRIVDVIIEVIRTHFGGAIRLGPAGLPNGVAPSELSEKLMAEIVSAGRNVKQSPDTSLWPEEAWDMAASYVAEFSARNLFCAGLMEKEHGRKVIEAMGGSLEDADQWCREFMKTS